MTTRTPAPLVLLACLGCGASPTSATPGPTATPPVASPALFGLPVDPLRTMMFGPGFTPTTDQWVGSWVFEKSSLQVDIVEAKGGLSATVGPIAAAPGLARPCEHVVAAAELSCKVRRPDNTDVSIAVRPATSNASYVEWLTLLVGGVPVAVGVRSDGTSAPD